MKRLSLAFFLAGIGLLSIVFVPIAVSQIRFYLDISHSLIDPTSVSLSRPNLVINVLGLAAPDLTQADAWFGSNAHPAPPVETKVKYFTLSLPRIGLDSVPVEVNGVNLAKNAVHFSGTSLPGSFGNPVIFGHSALPQFYKKGSPLTVFNHLPDVKIGDDLTVVFDGVTYHYIIRQTHEVLPSQMDVLDQPANRRLMTLVTCVPLGTYWRRFVVTAEMVD